MFIEKYNKYKTKVNTKVNIKVNTQIGGDGQFYIYTTGITNWNNENLITYWIEHIRQLVISKIPPGYSNITIIHYDPVLDHNDKKSMLDYTQKYNNILSKYTHSRIEYEIFVQDYFPIDMITSDMYNSHIIIDFAHIFQYVTRGEVKLHDRNIELSRQRTLKLHSVYLGYLGEEQRTENGFINRSIAKIQSNKFPFYIDNGVVTTYIDHLIIHKYKYNSLYPNNFIFEYVSSIANAYIYPILRNNKVNMDVIFSDAYQAELFIGISAYLFDANGLDNVIASFIQKYIKITAPKK